MKIANLWLFFFGQSAGTAFNYDGRIDATSVVSAVTSGPTAVEDSRGYFRRNALAEPVGSRAHARVARGWVEAHAVAEASGSRCRATSGLAWAEAESSVAGVVVRTTTSRRARGVAAGDVLAFASSSVVRARSANPTVEAGAGVVLQGSFARTRVGAGAHVEIGIDVVAAELEEILLLMEVA